eukprot:7385971-Prymnesium_polylepis.1
MRSPRRGSRQDIRAQGGRQLVIVIVIIRFGTLPAEMEVVGDRCHDAHTDHRRGPHRGHYAHPRQRHGQIARRPPHLLVLCSVAEFRFDGRDDADESPKPDVPLEPQPLPHVQTVRERTIPLPKRWECSRAFMHDVLCHRFLEGERLRKAIENGLHETAHSSCVGRDGSGKTRRAKVVRLERVENLALWKHYWHRKYEMIDMNFACNVK